ncbi:MAG: hypothetical protein H0V81_04985 [Solirubrobacterales bacterium]|nr:hypothetical protein [Solirubrobacterales bacterium]
MSKTDTEASPAAVDAAPPRRRSPPAEDERFHEVGPPRVLAGRATTEPVDPEPVSTAEPVFLSETVKRMGRRRTRILAVLSLLVAIGATLTIVDGFVAPEPAAPIEQATDEAWSAVTALSDGLRALEPDGALQPLRDEARTAREEVQAAGARIKTLELPISQTPLRIRVIRTLRADDAWIDAVGSTLANPRSSRRADLARLAEAAAVATALIADDVKGAGASVGGTGRLLSATKRG